MYLILFTGAPASGKSSLASALSKELGYKMISKDAYKIALYEKYGFNCHAEKKKLSIQGENMMYEAIEEYVKNDETLIVDNNFKNYDEIRRICKTANNCSIICINLVADSQKLADRYNARITQQNRHEALYTLDVYPIVEGVSHFHETLMQDDVVRIQENVTEETYGDFITTIDTNCIEQDFESVLNKAKEFINMTMEG